MLRFAERWRDLWSGECSLAKSVTCEHPHSSQHRAWVGHPPMRARTPAR